VDGVPVDDNQDFSYGFQTAGPGVSPISLIPQQDIENIEVLKDASATALYGSRGAYGVILITTKRGNSKVPIVTYNGQFFVSTVPKLRTVIGGKDERYLRMDQIMRSDTSYYHALGLINGTSFIADSLNAYYNNSTNWQSYFYRTTYNQTHNLNIAGGNQAFNYKVNFGYFDQKGIQENTGFSRANLRMNMQYMPNQKFKLAANVNSALGSNQKGSGNGLTNSGVASGGASSSLLPSPSQYSAVNSVLGAVTTDNDNKTINVNSTIEMKYEFVKNFSLTSNFNYTFETGTEDNFLPAAINGDRSSLYTYNGVKNAIYNRNLLQYLFSIKDKEGDDAHNFLIYAFNETNSNNFKADVIRNDKVVNDYLRGPIVGVNSYVTSLGGTLDNFYMARSAAFAGSFRYDFKRRYVFDATYRMDGSSSSGPDAGYTKNPSVGVRWNINNEPFMKTAAEKWLDYASIRLTYGTVIQPSGNVYDVYGKYVSTGNYNGNPSVTIENWRMPNTNLQPVQNTTLNFGFDFGILKNRLFGSFEAYYKQTDHIFGSKSIANINGYANVSTNEEALVNIGYEGSLTASLLPNGSKSRWTVSVNGAINHDYMAALPNGVRQVIIVDAQNGQSILKRLGTNALSNFIYHTKGIYANTSDVAVDPLTGLRYRAGSSGDILSYYRAGDPRYTDLNGDYILDSKDLVDAGNSQIRFNGGVTMDFRYKNFSVQMQGNYVLGRDILNNSLAAQFQAFNNPTQMNGLVPISQYDIWTTPGQIAKYPNPYDYLRTRFVDPYRFAQTLFQEDGSYFKLGYISMNYALNQEYTRRLGMNRVALGFTLNNVFMISNYSGPNPEAVSALGRDYSGGYPVPKTFVFNLNVEF
jgi:TonB-linked SusC/RagA family outer membrane protein